LNVKHSDTLKTEAEYSSEMLISIYQTTKRHTQEDRKLSLQPGTTTGTSKSHVT